MRRGSPILDGLLLHGAPIRLTQVLSNVLTNAAKYGNPGGRIHVRARTEDGNADVPEAMRAPPELAALLASLAEDGA